LFYVADNGQELVPVSRPVLYGATPLEQARRIIEAAVEPAPEGQRSAIPEGTTVRSVFLAADGNTFVDLGGAIVTGHSGGSLNEALTVYAIVNAVTVNLPDIAAVQILVDGKQVDTLAGHIDLKYPLGKALEWVRKGQ
jgi:spore germination protein GerM